MTDRLTHRQKLLLRTLLISLLCLTAVFLAVRSQIPQAPSRFADAGAAPVRMQWHEGAWYWLETPKNANARLMRADDSGARPIAEAKQIPSYFLADGKIAWTAQEADAWNIVTAAHDGSGKQTLWSGARAPRGLCLAEGHVYWLEQVPAAVPDSGPMPPLGNTLRVLSLPLEGGAPSEIASLMEPDGEQVVGVHSGRLYFTAYRPGPPGVTMIYQKALAGGEIKRIAGEAGRHHVLLSREGGLFWTAPSAEDSRANIAVCIRRLDAAGKPETVMDWLPVGGQIFETHRGLLYVDGSFQPMAWPVSASKQLPRPVPMGQDFGAVAAGNGELLLRRMYSSLSDYTLYRVSLP